MTGVDFYINGKPTPDGAFALDVSKRMTEQVENLLQSTAYLVIDDQVKKGNEPSEILVDNVSNKPLTQAKRNIDVRFGSAFTPETIAVVERALIRNIKRYTERFTGTLADMSNWNWYLQDFSKGGTGEARRVNPTRIKTLSREQRLLLVPTGVINEKGEPYGTAAELALLRGKRGTGFMYATKEALNRNRRFNNFYFCKVGESKKDALPGEVSSRGTKCLVIRPRLKKRVSRGRPR